MARRPLRVVSWNVHGCVGSDGSFHPERTAAVLAELRPDVALLQEVGDNLGVHPPVDQATLLATALGMTSVLGTTLYHSVHGYGNVTLTRLPVAASETYDLSVRGREPRVCLCVGVGAVDGSGAPALRTVNMHLGLGRRERRTQIGILLDEAGPLLDDPHVPTVVCGDFNDFPPGAATRALESLFTDAARLILARPRPTFPSRRPLLRLDRCYVGPSVEVRRVRVVDSGDARRASDHLPLVVEIAVDDAARTLAEREARPLRRSVS